MEGIPVGARRSAQRQEPAIALFFYKSLVTGASVSN